MPAESFRQVVSTLGVSIDGSRDETYFDALDFLPKEANCTNEGLRKRNRRLDHQNRSNGIFADEKSLSVGQIGCGQMSLDEGQGGATTRFAKPRPRKLLDDSETGRNLLEVDKGRIGSEDMSKGIPADEEVQFMVKDGSMEHSGYVPRRERSVKFRLSASARESSDPLRTTDTSLTQVVEENVTKSIETVDSLDAKILPNMNPGGNEGSSLDTASKSLAMLSKRRTSELSGVTSPSQGVESTEAPRTIERDHTALSSKLGLEPDSSDVGSDLIGTLDGSSAPETVNALPSPSQARNRWQRAKTKLAFVHHISEGHRRAAAGDFLEDGGGDQTVQSVASGTADDPAIQGARSRKELHGSSGQVRAKGRKGQEGMVVKQDKGMIALVQDFYVACLKMHIAHFLIGVFLAPMALGLLFTPIYLFDKGGLSFHGEASDGPESTMVGRAAKAKQNISHLMDVFLYALSLSTTFGGSPVAALSTYCLCVANVNTLMGQFLFVFLSGAVFARMSQPSQPIRCSKFAVIRADEFTSLPSEDRKDKPKVFAVRLVLTGPPPCELVDAKICLTFRILIKLPTGSMFCSTQDLTLVRPEISYLRYGILVRHVIDDKSPIYGHTMESLVDGDASFSLTIMGLERASMQPIFHLEDYFVCDGDVAWDADYIDFIHLDKAGNRVLDHSKLDLIRVTENTKMGGDRKGKRGSRLEKVDEDGIPNHDANVRGVKAGQFTKSKSTAWRSKSNSFTRADW